MRTTLITIITAILTSCGGNAPAPIITVAPEAAALVAELEEELGVNLAAVSISIEDFPPSASAVGTCYSNGKVVLNKVFFERGGVEVKSLLLHEIGHCGYGLDHTKETFRDGCATSLMFAYNQAGCISHYWEDYKADYLERIGADT